MLQPKDYLDKRVLGQADGYYLKRAAEYRPKARLLRGAEFALAIVAMLVTIYAGAAGKTFSAGELTFDIAAITAVLTTVSGAILSHLESTRLEYLADSYSAVARRLKDQVLQFDKAQASPEAWSKFVNKCEDIIAAENNSWMAKWSEDK